MIKLYGNPRTSAGRCYLMLEECELKYEVVDLDIKSKQHKSQEYLKLNPNGKVPTLIDGDFVIWESLAINRYLAEKYKPELLGKSIESKSLIEQWSVWALAEFQPPLIDIIIQTMFVPAPQKDEKIIERAKAKLPEKFGVLNKSLENKEYMVDDKYSLADINLASVANIGLGLGMSYKEYPHISTWLEKIKSRPAYKKVATLRG